MVARTPGALSADGCLAVIVVKPTGQRGWMRAARATVVHEHVVHCGLDELGRDRQRLVLEFLAERLPPRIARTWFSNNKVEDHYRRSTTGRGGLNEEFTLRSATQTVGCAGRLQTAGHTTLYREYIEEALAGLVDEPLSRGRLAELEARGPAEHFAGRLAAALDRFARGIAGADEVMTVVGASDLAVPTACGGIGEACDPFPWKFSAGGHPRFVLRPTEEQIRSGFIGRFERVEPGTKEFQELVYHERFNAYVNRQLRDANWMDRSVSCKADFRLDRCGFIVESKYSIWPFLPNPPDLSPDQLADSNRACETYRAGMARIERFPPMPASLWREDPWIGFATHADPPERTDTDGHQRDEDRYRQNLIQLERERMAREWEVPIRPGRDLPGVTAEIRKAVARHWHRPTGVPHGLTCSVTVVQDASGKVHRVEIAESSGNVAFDRSVEQAVRAASPLPRPTGFGVIYREITFLFKPRS